MNNEENQENQEKQVIKKTIWQDLWECLQQDLFEETYSTLYDKGLKFYKKGDFSKASYYFEKAYDRYSKDFNCLYNLALSYHSGGNLKDAIRFYTLALDIDPKDYDTIYNIGLCYLDTQNSELALEFLKQASVSNEQDYDAKMNYILALIEDKQIDEGLKETVELVKYNRNLLTFALIAAKAIERKSSISQEDQNLNKAIKLINSYLDQNKKDANAYLQLSTCYSKKGDWSESLKYSLMALELAPKSYEINANTGFVLYCNQSYERALSFYKKALSLDKKPNPQMHVNIAHAYEKMGLIEEAIEKLKYVLKHFKEFENREAVEKYFEELKNPPKEPQEDDEFEAEAENVLQNETPPDDNEAKTDETSAETQIEPDLERQEFQDPYQQLADDN